MREVRIRDTLSGELRSLEPRDPGRVGIYACGPTTYARIHVGNARPYVVFMLLKRFLEHEGHAVTLVINVTDINDRIYDAAREGGRPSTQLAEEMTRAYLEDTDRLGLGRPDEEPLASETIPEIVALIEELSAGGHAYQADGDVYFRVRSFDGYGKLSNRDPEEMDQGEEAGTESLKEDRLDFALWKARKPDEDAAWDSPWGPGRPGWHIECSAMAEKYLGPDFAVHGGGADLVFPHHENEIAQTEAARGVPLARLWMHNGMVQVAEEKMAKSVGNIFQLSEALDRFGPATLVAYLISGHYRQPLEFSTEALREAESRVERIRNFLRKPEPARDPAAPGQVMERGDERRRDRLVPVESEEAAGYVAERRDEFFAALADDFNTPRALAALFELVAEGNRRSLPGARAALEEMLPIVGLDSLLAPEAEADAESRELLAERERARAARDFERADRIRDELAQRGWEVRDAPEGARLVRRG